MNTEKITPDIIRNSFCMSKSGRFICGLESLILYSLVAVIIFYFFKAIENGVGLLAGEKSSFYESNDWLLITMAIIGAIVGFISGYKMYFSFFVWRFFKPNEKYIKKYIQSEINRLEESISSNRKYLLRKNADLASEAENVQKLNTELFEKASGLQSLLM